MRESNDVVGKPIISIDEGRQLGHRRVDHAVEASGAGGPPSLRWAAVGLVRSATMATVTVGAGHARRR